MKITLIILAALTLAACAGGPVADYAVGGALAAVAALDAMLARGVITPEEYAALRAGVESGVSPEALAAGAGGTGAALVKIADVFLNSHKKRKEAKRAKETA